MVTIRDRQLSSTYANLESRLRRDPGTKIDEQGMVKLLGAVADTWFRGADEMTRKLSRTGITRDEQLALVKNGMDSREKADLGTILDEGKVPMTDDVRKFLEQVLERQEVLPTDGALRIGASNAGGVIQGTVAAGTVIEAINLSTAPNQRLTTSDTFVLATADGTGKFKGVMPDMKEGDVVRVRTRDAQGNVGNWVTIRAKGMGTDDRNAEVALFRMGLTARADGKVDLVNINASRPISEPGAQLRFVNERTGEQVTLTMNDVGNFPEGTTLPGKAGDSFSVRASDGNNNKDFTAEVGKVTVPGATGGGGAGGVDLKDPALHKDEMNADGTPKFATKRYSGPLFVDGAKPEDVKQGQIGNCYLPAAISALAKTHPEVLKNMIKDNGDGTYTVTFKEADYRTRTYVDKKITVDGDLYSRSWGGPLYGASAGNTSADKMEMWWPVLEKAYAQLKGSYDSIGNGGIVSQVFENVIGKRPSDMYLGYGGSSDDKVWAKVTSALDAGMPVGAGTYGKDQADKYTNSGVYPNHAYSILGHKTENGERYLQMRNPWGESEPRPGDGKNDGVFWLKLSDFTKLYQSVYTVA